MNKNILIIVSCGVLIGSAIASYVYISNGALEGSQGNHVYNHSSMMGNGNGVVTLNTTLPSDTPTIKVYNLISRQYSLQMCKEKIEKVYPNWLNKDTEIKEASDNNYIRFSNGVEVIKIWKNGCLEFINNSALDKSDELSKKALKNTNAPENQAIENITMVEIEGQLCYDELYNRSLNYVKNHGGMPDGCYLSSSNKAINGLGDKQVVSQFGFNFDRKVDGTPVIGSGEGANIQITPIGDIYRYILLWRGISDSYNDVKVKNAAAAYDSLKKIVDQNLTIEKIELAYYTEDFHSQQTVISPVWAFYYDQDYEHYYCVDAVGLKFVF